MSTGNAQAGARKRVLGDGDELARFGGGCGLVRDLGDLAPDENGALLLAAAVKLFVALSVTALVDVEIVDAGVVTDLLLDQVGVLEGIHAADPRAVLVVVHVPAADTVQDGDTFRRAGKPAVFIPDQNFAARRAGGVAQALELQAGENVRVAAVAELPHRARVHQVVAGRQDDAADLHLDLLGRHAVVDGLGLAYPHALHALAAAAAVETAAGLAPGLVLTKVEVHLAKPAHTLGRIQMPAADAFLTTDILGDLGPILAGRRLRGGLGRHRRHVLLPEKSLDRLHGLVTRGHGFNDGRRPAHGIAGGEHIRQGGLQGVRVDRDGAPRRSSSTSRHRRPTPDRFSGRWPE